MLRLILGLLQIPNRISNTISLKRKKVQYFSCLKINGRIVIRGNGQISISKNVKINSSFLSNSVGLATATSIETFKGARIYIGENVGISNSVLSCRTKMQIEEDVLIGGGCHIIDHDFHSIKFSHRMESPDINVKSKPITIKCGAFIGARSFIMKGSVIGKRAVIGANSVVSGIIPDDEVWAGNPAKFVYKIDNS